MTIDNETLIERLERHAKSGTGGKQRTLLFEQAAEALKTEYQRGVEAALTALSGMPILAAASGNPDIRSQHPWVKLSFVDLDRMRAALRSGEPQPDWAGEAEARMERSVHEAQRDTWQYGWVSYLVEGQDYEWGACSDRDAAKARVELLTREEERIWPDATNREIFQLARRRYVEPGPWEVVPDGE